MITKVPTGLAFEVPDGMVMKIYPRSGLATKFGVTLANCVGIVDAGYRGEVQIPMYALFKPYMVSAGDSVAQAEICPVREVRFVEAKTLTPSDRGTSGFGGSGK